MSQFKSFKGFTLIELLVVMLLLAISLSIVLPLTMNQIDAAKERSERQKILVFIQNARALSLFNTVSLNLLFEGKVISVESSDSLRLELEHTAFETGQVTLHPFVNSDFELNAVIRNKTWQLVTKDEQTSWVNPD